MYQRRTLRKMSPETRLLAQSANDMEKAYKRLKAVVDNRYEVEKDSKAKIKAFFNGGEHIKMMPKDDWPEPLAKADEGHDYKYDLDGNIVTSDMLC